MRKLVGLQYLRGLAAVAVVVFHAGNRAGLNFHAGEAGVDLFFLLSGFLMVAITGPQTRPLAFIADRLRRIVPVYWIASSMMLIGWLVGAFPSLRLEAEHVIASYLFVPWFLPGTDKPWPLLVPGWTLNYEMMFYLLFAALLPLGRQAWQIAVLTAVFVALVASRLVVEPDTAIAITYTDPILLEFAGGCWLGLLWKIPGDWPRWLGLGTAMVALVAIVAGGTLIPQVDRTIIFGLPAAVMLASVLAMERRGTIGERRLPLFIGDASYSIYIWHTLVISVIMLVCVRLGLPREVAVVVGVIGGVVAGTVAYWLIERPILRYFRERRYVAGAPVPAGP